MTNLPKRVLVVGMTENPGGIEALLLNVLERSDSSKIHFDFIANVPKVAFEDRLLKSGCKVYHVTMRHENRRKNHTELEALFREHAKEYDAVWENANSLANIDYLFLAKKYGIPVRIIHGHNSTNSEGLIRGLFHAINRQRVRAVATHFWSVSNHASPWLFGRDYMFLPNYRIITNTIETDRFFFNLNARNAIRNQYGIPQTAIVLGNVGRLHEQKNQALFLLLLGELVNRGMDCYGIILGEGPLRSSLQAQAKELKISDRLIMPGIVEDTSGYYSAFDLFVFPSLYEGLGIALLEAQASGTPCLVSDGIPSEAIINSNVKQCRLSESVRTWARSAELLLTLGRDVSPDIIGSQYDSNNAGSLFDGIL